MSLLNPLPTNSISPKPLSISTHIVEKKKKMASASSLQVSISTQYSSSAINKQGFFLGGFSHLRPNFYFSLPRPVLVCSRRRRNKPTSPLPSSKKKKNISSSKGVGKEKDIDDDPFEALFQQLAEDLENDDINDDNEEITEEEFAELERELDKVLEEGDLMELFNSMVTDTSGKEVKGNVEEEEEDEEDDKLEEGDANEDKLEEEEDDEKEITEEELAEFDREVDKVLEETEEELMGLFNSTVNDASGKEVKDNAEEEEDDEEDELEEDEEDELEEDDEEEDESDEEETQVELRRWQLKRLAYALKTGRRKANIKNLAADLCLDRAIVLKLLRDPPPDLLTFSATLPDEEPEETFLDPDIETVTLPVKRDSRQLEAKTDVPIHVQRRGWSTQKRIKKVHVETLERVYQKSKRPTGAMVSNIVHVTSLPRRTVVKWFEDRRNKDGVPDRRKPYERSATEPGVFTSS